MAYRNMMAMGKMSLQEKIIDLERSIPEDKKTLKERNDLLKRLIEQKKSSFFTGSITREIEGLKSTIKYSEESLAEDEKELKELKAEKDEEERKKKKIANTRKEMKIKENIKEAENKYGRKNRNNRKNPNYGESYGGSRKKSKGSKKRSTRRK